MEREGYQAEEITWQFAFRMALTGNNNNLHLHLVFNNKHILVEIGISLNDSVDCLFDLDQIITVMWHIYLQESLLNSVWFFYAKNIRKRSP
jgi:hypothetical protein